MRFSRNHEQILSHDASWMKPPLTPKRGLCNRDVSASTNAVLLPSHLVPDSPYQPTAENMKSVCFGSIRRKLYQDVRNCFQSAHVERSAFDNILKSMRLSEMTGKVAHSYLNDSHYLLPVLQITCDFRLEYPRGLNKRSDALTSFVPDGLVPDQFVHSPNRRRYIIQDLDNRILLSHFNRWHNLSTSLTYLG